MNEAATTKPVSGVAAWYALPVGEATRQLRANTQSGLDQSEAAERLLKHGPNRLPEVG
jgi:hypothetical protein